IGSGRNGSATVTIYNGNIKGISDCYGAGIGSGEGGKSTVIIYDGDIKAYGGFFGAGIGSGFWDRENYVPSKCSITLYGGEINATGGDLGADIGAGYRSDATVNDYRKGTGTGTLMSTGSIVIICVVGGVALISAGVFIFLHVKKKKKSE
ncbi:MAG: hypothetical protein MJ066_05890, partial [Clostridia bacterium]|nr:hypothetical protein [Clostridia bacterium]